MTPDNIRGIEGDSYEIIRPTDSDRFSVDSANRRAAVFEALNNTPITWLENGDGTTLPEEMIREGRHIYQPERMPDWVAARIGLS